MTLLYPGFNNMKAISAIFLVVSIVCLITPAAIAQDQAVTDTTDLSQMDWSDEPEGQTDLSQESWADEPDSTTEGNELSNMSWEDEEGENVETNAGGQSAMTAEEELAIESEERRIHFLGFLMFVGYIFGALLTGFFTRNRKLAVDYPPELLILLHTVWPLEWVFMLFAGKKVR